MGCRAVLLPVAKEAAEAAASPTWAVTHEVVRVLEATLGATMYRWFFWFNDYVDSAKRHHHCSMSTLLHSLTSLCWALIATVGSTTVVLTLTTNPWWSVSRVVWRRGCAVCAVVTGRGSLTKQRLAGVAF
jgi:hypothetical protein